MNHVESRSNDTANGATTRQALTFALGQEVYGVDILRVKEIRGWAPVTRIPQSPAAVLGVLNLRGAIVPIVDLRVRFAMQSAEFNAVTVVIVLSLRTADGERECGIVVDSVRDVVDIAAGSVRPAPTMQGCQANEFIEGITTLGEQMLVLLDADRLVSGELSPLALTAAA
jgi:purine-binding chemotaxis protein CheW